MNLRKYSKYLEKLYNDRMDIIRTSKIVDGAETLNISSNSPLYFNIPCRVSFGSQKDLPVSDNENYEEKLIMPTIFCSPNVDIKAGDSVTIRRCYSDGTVYQSFIGYLSTTGQPNIYETHMEFNVTLRNDA